MPMAQRSGQTDRTPFSEEEKRHLRERADVRISQLCNAAALVIILVALAAFVLGQGDSFYSQVGIMVSIALLAIAALNDPSLK